ncbi:hypothetical protein BKA93DRAFT_824533 [Sparassis latifolia]|uniref:Hydrophobin n=1 Tax=Sparassis crispa TaxID=139825 RepID=A0A401GZ84_9APHY|nr:hypothetical protein SCP_1101490 [Sparassis crispa]GBE87473.1 hypothetical protein SCP_1101490 [Sparassis crispa]
MFSLRILSLLALAFSGVNVLAAPQSSGTTCNGGGSIDCCTTTFEPECDEANIIIDALRIDRSTLPDGMIATACGGGGVNVGGGSTCDNIPVCCTDNFFGGAVGVGCSPIPVSV